jgi:hypothetical protein
VKGANSKLPITNYKLPITKIYLGDAARPDGPHSHFALRNGAPDASGPVAVQPFIFIGYIISNRGLSKHFSQIV